MYHHHKHKRHALAHARKKRSMGYVASIYPSKSGWGVSVTRR